MRALAAVNAPCLLDCLVSNMLRTANGLVMTSLPHALARTYCNCIPGDPAHNRRVQSKTQRFQWLLGLPCASARRLHKSVPRHGFARCCRRRARSRDDAMRARTRARRAEPRHKAVTTTTNNNPRRAAERALGPALRHPAPRRRGQAPPDRAPDRGHAAQAPAQEGAPQSVAISQAAPAVFGVWF